MTLLSHLNLTTASAQLLLLYADHTHLCLGAAMAQGVEWRLVVRSILGKILHPRVCDCV